MFDKQKSKHKTKVVSAQCFSKAWRMQHAWITVRRQVMRAWWGLAWPMKQRGPSIQGLHFILIERL